MAESGVSAEIVVDFSAMRDAGVTGADILLQADTVSKRIMRSMTSERDMIADGVLRMRLGWPVSREPAKQGGL